MLPLPTPHTQQSAAEKLQASPIDLAAVKRERRFRNAMRARGGRVRTSEEMRGVCFRNKALEDHNFATASTDEEMKESGAWRVRSSNPDGSTFVLSNFFAPTPGRVMYLHDKRQRGAVPPSIG